MERHAGIPKINSMAKLPWYIKLTDEKMTKEGIEYTIVLHPIYRRWLLVKTVILAIFSIIFNRK